ncbi:hypothetical protein LZC95_10035 [Pendulispora brunnea]|uniref:Entry exclusion lipoprotein TrbK n=1 Tax=Pendulispora brunnea TaxID=2905690 RepID=A0ABZ2KEQ1_9BACT
MRRIMFAIGITLFMQSGLGCSSNDSPASPQRDAGPNIPPCVQNPKTHEEILNACTADGVEKIEKKPALPLLGPNGERPALP